MSSAHILSDQEKQLAVFDLDHTLLKKNCSVSFFFFLFKRNFFSKGSLVYYFFYFIHYRFFSKSMESLHEKIFSRFLKGKSILVLEGLAQEFWEKNFPKLIRGSVVERLLKAKKEKATILILSASPEFLVKPLAKKLHVDLFKGTQYEVDDKNIIRKIHIFVHGEKKVEYVSALQKELMLESVSAYSDCISDLPLLQIARVPVCVSPKKKLAALCKKYNWETIDG